MKCSHLLVVLDEDYSESDKEILRLKTYLNTVAGLYFVTKYDNGLQYLIDVGLRDKVGKAIDRSSYTVVHQGITEKEYILILKPLRNSFKDIDDHRISGLFEKDD